jgi:hypothetical protein
VAPGIRKLLGVPRRSGAIGSVLGFRSWDPAVTLIPGLPVGSGSWDSEPFVEASFVSRGCGGSGRSVTSTIPTCSAVAVTYNRGGSPGSGATITGGDVRYRLSSWNTSSASSVQTKGPDL